MKRVFNILLFFICIEEAWASEVLNVASDQIMLVISNDPSRDWKKMDQVCILEKSGRITACGLIISKLSKGAVVKLSVRMGEVKTGDYAQWVIVPWLDKSELGADGNRSIDEEDTVRFDNPFILDMHQKAVKRDVMYIKGEDIARQEIFSELQEGAGSEYSLGLGIDFFLRIRLAHHLGVGQNFRPCGGVCFTVGLACAKSS